MTSKQIKDRTIQTRDEQARALLDAVAAQDTGGPLVAFFETAPGSLEDMRV